jgi:hypothetical protein
MEKLISMKVCVRKRPLNKTEVESKDQDITETSDREVLVNEQKLNY